MKYACYLFLMLLVAAGCGDDKAPGGGNAGQPSSPAGKEGGTPGDFYKRFSGTVGNQEVVVHLHKYGLQISGYCQYAGKGQSFKLVSWEDTILDNAYYLTETRRDAGGGGDPHWTLAIQDGKATGKWRSGDGKTSYDIHLEAAYPEGSLPLSAYYYTDTASMYRSLADPKANVSYGIVWPDADDRSESAAFARSAIAVDMKLEVVEGPLQALKTRAWRYFGNYRLDIGKVLDSTATAAERKSPAYQYAATFHHYVVYNDGQWLILEDAISNYTGGAHGIYGATYQNLDLSASRPWRLHDIVSDTAAMQPLLDEAARSYFHIPPEAAMSSRTLVDRVPVTTNFYLTPAGLTFVYNPYDIASYADGVISLFIPYEQLLPLLTPAFKKRVGLETQPAGAV